MNRELEPDCTRAAPPITWQAATIQREANRFIKRFIDISVSLVVLIFLAPILAIICVIIRLDTPGPAIFRQERVGARRVRRNSRVEWEQARFHCYKFRSMVCHADPDLHKRYVQALIQNDQNCMEEIQGGDNHLRKMVKDPRITRVGHFLRKTSMDELPQFYNVLIGNMSLVGPRPAIPYEVEIYKPWHYQRFNALPGLTGMWQVTARSSADFDEMVWLDILYIENQSLWLDLKILFKTPLVVIACRGAY